MKPPDALHEHFVGAAQRFPDNTAVIEPGHGAITYRDLATLSDRLRDRLSALGVRPGDRVGIYMRKSIDAVGAIYGILKAGAAYVPVDPGAPPARNAYILQNCAVKAIVMERRFDEKLLPELAALGPVPERLLIDNAGAGAAATQGARRSGRAGTAPPEVPTQQPAPIRPRLHPLHVRLDRQAQGRDALARERRELRRLVHRSLRAAAGRSLLLACAVPFRPLDPGHPRPAQARRDAGAGRRRRREGRRSPSRL